MGGHSVRQDALTPMKPRRHRITRGRDWWRNTIHPSISINPRVHDSEGRKEESNFTTAEHKSSRSRCHHHVGCAS